MSEVVVADADAMRSHGRDFASRVRAGDVIVLAGPLGAGKTTWVQGLADGMGVRGPITSPTFVIARVHPSLRGGPSLVHVDAYRVGGALEFEDLGLADDVERAVTVVEWGEQLAPTLGQEWVQVTIDRPAGADGATGEGGPRRVSVAGSGDRWADAAR